LHGVLEADVEAVRRDGVPLVLDRPHATAEPVEPLAEVLLQAVHELEPQSVAGEVRLRCADDRELARLRGYGRTEVLVAEDREILFERLAALAAAASDAGVPGRGGLRVHDVGSTDFALGRHDEAELRKEAGLIRANRF